jgi:hypothetical protein
MPGFEGGIGQAAGKGDAEWMEPEGRAAKEVEEGLGFLRGRCPGGLPLRCELAPKGRPVPASAGFSPTGQAVAHFTTSESR